jgi:CRISPR type III-A/MTUBE-associated protein Csm6
MKRVLFSPVGTTDPIRGNYDGPFLHIIRNYKPEVIYIFLTKEMNAIDEKMDLYEKAARKIVPDAEIIKLHHAEFDKPHDFNLSHKIVSRDLNEILLRHKDDEIIANVTSSTTQIQNCIYLVAAISKKHYKLVQVPTPRNASNDGSRVDISFDLEKEWANNLDNLIHDSEIKNRCIEIIPENVRKIVATETILSHIKRYDYKAAYEVAMDNSPLINSSICNLLQAADLRLSLFYNEASLLAKKLGYQFVTVRSNDAVKIFEYLMYLKIRMEQNEVCEFARAVTPLFLEISKAYLENVFKINILQYCEDKNGIDWLISNRLKEDSDLFAYYDQTYHPNFRDAELAFSNALPMIEYYCIKNNRLKDLDNARNLREFEKNVRNVAAHQIEGLTPEILKQKYGFDMENIFDCLKSFFTTTFQNYVKNSLQIWDTYTLLNENIAGALNTNVVN